MYICYLYLITIIQPMNQWTIDQPMNLLQHVEYQVKYADSSLLAYFLRLSANAALQFSYPWLVHISLVTTKTSDREIPDFFTAQPTSCSFLLTQDRKYKVYNAYSIQEQTQSKNNQTDQIVNSENARIQSLQMYSVLTQTQGRLSQILRPI